MIVHDIPPEIITSQPRLHLHLLCLKDPYRGSLFLDHSIFFGQFLWVPGGKILPKQQGPWNAKAWKVEEPWVWFCRWIDGWKCGEGRENFGATPGCFFWGGEGRKWYLGTRVWCLLRLVFLLSAVFLYVFVCVSVVFQLLPFPETNQKWHLKTHVWKTMIISFWGSLGPRFWRAFEAEIRC